MMCQFMHPLTGMPLFRMLPCLPIAQRIPRAPRRAPAARLLLLLFALLTLWPSVMECQVPAVETTTQPEARQPSPRLRYTGRLLSLALGSGFLLHQGEFAGSFTAPLLHAELGYTMFPELGVTFSADIGSMGVKRDATAVDPVLYKFQFPRDTELRGAESSIDISSFTISAEVNLFPRQFYNVFFTAGAGLAFYKSSDFDDAVVRPTADFPATVAVPVGVGAEYFITRTLSAQLLLKQHFLFRGDIDAFDPAEIAAEYNRRRRPRIDLPAGGNDGFLSASLSLRWFLFESNDYDGDLLLNAEEEEIGTSPYRVDTDIDGLTDFEEVRLYTTNPLKFDTDDDGLGDYMEIMKYNTNPRKPDTDDDLLSDYDELMRHNTDPNNPDTDLDKLSDYEEVILYTTNPRNPDTDYDGLDDYAEVKVNNTDPLRPDTDDDGIYDFNEVITYRTNPRSNDTDADRLLDYDEIAYYGTNPLNPDTDSDRASDYSEVFETRSNPLRYDENLPVTQGGDRRYFAELLETRPLPGGGISYLIAPVITAPPASRFQPGTLDSLIANMADSTLQASRDGTGAITHREADPYRRRTVQHVPPRSRRTMLRIDSLTLRAGDILSFCNITFEYDRDQLQQSYLPLLDEALRLFQSNQGMTVEIRGHTDSDGDENYNQALSERRARSVRDYFVGKGIASTRFRTVGFGESNPIADDRTEEGRERNRRVELYIISMGSERGGSRQ